MGRSLRSQLFLNGLVIVLVGMGLAGFLFWRSAETLYLETRRENMLAQAVITAAGLIGQQLPVQPAETYSQVSNVMPGTHTRVIAPEGAVVIGLPELTASGASLQMPAAEDNAMVSPDELRQRLEIQSALKGTPATQIRTVLNGSRRVMYAAAPIPAADGTVSGIVYMAEPLPKSGLPAGFITQLGFSLMAAALLALGAGVYLSRRIEQPVAEVITAAGRAGEGDLDRRVMVNSGITELNALGGAFNRMTASLKQSNQAQQAFVADVAHELRTPLTVIKGTIETLEDGAMDDLDGRGKLVTSMQNETERLIRLVNDLLVLTRADAGLLKLNLQPVDLATLVRQRFERFEPAAARRQISIEIKAEAASTVTGDANRLAQVVDNLIDNALRYSPENGAVKVDIRMMPGGVCECGIHDDGPGIPPEHLPRIFDRFYRVENARDKRGGEAGLGLSIVRSLLQTQGGTIRAESTTGQGTTLTFQMPASPI